MVLKLGRFGKYIRNTWKVLKCAGEVWRKSVELIVWEMKKGYIKSQGEAEYPTYSKKKEG